MIAIIAQLMIIFRIEPIEQDLQNVITDDEISDDKISDD